MDWSFEFNGVPSSGLHLFDVQFRGERILYELGVGDAFASYSGLNPIQSIENLFIQLI